MMNNELYDKLKNELNINKKQIAWLKKFLKIINKITLFCLAVSLLLMMSLNLFFTDIFPPYFAINKLLPIGIFGGICTMVTGGTLVFANILFLGSEFYFKKRNQKLSDKLKELSKTINKDNVSKNDKLIGTKIEVKKQLNYSYNNRNIFNIKLTNTSTGKNVKTRVKTKKNT